jgi:hypothetical protein
MFKTTGNLDSLGASGLIVPWGLGTDSFCDCPWLKARAQIRNQGEFWNAVNTLIIMQDWGCLSDKEEFSDAVECVLPFFNDAESLKPDDSKDTTFRNLWAEIHEGTQSGEIALTNAIWGLRTGESKTGYLGAATHKAWFSNWAGIVKEFLDNLNEQKKKIIFCGEWARDWGAKEFTKLSGESAVSYLKHYATWAGKPEEFKELQANFEIYFLRHPSASGPWVPKTGASKQQDLQFKEVDYSPFKMHC